MAKPKQVDVYAVDRKDGGVTIMRCLSKEVKRKVVRDDGSVESIVQRVMPDPQECIAKWSKEARVAVVKVTPIKESDVPKDRSFRRAWQGCDKQGVRVCPETSREVMRDKIRWVREQRFAALDVDYIRALEEGDDVKMAEVRAEKQALRDAPADLAIDECKDYEDLKKHWPKELLGVDFPHKTDPKAA